MKKPQWVINRIQELEKIIQKPSCPCCSDSIRKKDALKAQKEIDAINTCKEFLEEKEIITQELWKS